MVGHTHNNIDASFGHWSIRLHEEDFAHHTTSHEIIHGFLQCASDPAHD